MELSNNKDKIEYAVMNPSKNITILVLSDVYKAWNVDSDNALLKNLKKQAPNVALMHPEYSKEKVIEEGELAHEALFNFIKNLVIIEPDL